MTAFHSGSYDDELARARLPFPAKTRAAAQAPPGGGAAGGGGGGDSGAEGAGGGGGEGEGAVRKAGGGGRNSSSGGAAPSVEVEPPPPPSAGGGGGDHHHKHPRGGPAPPAAADPAPAGAAAAPVEGGGGGKGGGGGSRGGKGGGGGRSGGGGGGGNSTAASTGWKKFRHGVGILPSPVPYKPVEGGGGGAGPVSVEVTGDKGSLADASPRWAELRQAARNVVQSGKVTLTSAYSEELPLLLNWFVRLEVSKMLLMMDVGRSVLVLSLDERIHATLLAMQVPSFYVGEPTVAKREREAVELRGQWELAMDGMDAIWSDMSTVWMWDVGQTWMRVAPPRVDIVSPACGKREICLGLTMVRSNERTKGYLRRAYELAAGGGAAGAKGAVLAGADASWHSDMLGVREEEEGARLSVMLLPRAQFPVLGKDGRWEQLMNGGLVWCLPNSRTHDASEIRGQMASDGVYLLADNWEDRVRGSPPNEWFCRALSPERVIEGGRQSPPNQYWRRCENDGLVSAMPAGSAAPKNKGAARAKEAENGTMFRSGTLGMVYTHASQRKGGQGNQVIMQLSQGRAGSTVTGNMMLRSHPFCGMYIDELMWGIYRTRMAREGEGDFDRVLDIFFNSTQCMLPTKLWGNAKDGAPGTLASWFGKRDRFGMGVRSRGKDYFKIDNQARVCAGLAAEQPPRAVCVKELKFLGRVGDLLRGAVRRGVRFSILYLLRDPRATTLSQLYSFSLKWFQGMANPMTDVLREQCRIAASDVEAIVGAPEGVEARQVCFEDFKDDPKGALSSVYGSFGPFRQWWERTGGDLIPQEVAEFGEEHIANWHPNGSEARRSALKPVQYGQVPVGFDHHYSTDVSRIVHVDSWRDVYVRDRSMQEVWLKDEGCIKLRRISKCAASWPDLDTPGAYAPRVSDVPVEQVADKGTFRPGSGGTGGKGAGGAR